MPAEVAWAIRAGVITDKLVRQLEYSLDSLTTPFARLTFLASVRDPYTGHYLHEGWSTIASPEKVHEALRTSHREVFTSVVGLSLIELCGELKEHFASLGRPERKTATLWIELEPYREMIPQGCLAIERSHFLSQLKLALQVLVCSPELVVDQEEPAASPPPQLGPQPRPRYPN